MQTYWSLMGVGRLQESNHRLEPRGASSEKRSGHIYFMEDNLLHSISKLCHVYFQVVTKASHRMRQVVAYKRLETMQNISTFRPKKWTQSLTGGGCLLEVPAVRLWLKCFG